MFKFQAAASNIARVPDNTGNGPELPHLSQPKLDTQYSYMRIKRTIPSVLLLKQNAKNGSDSPCEFNITKGP